MSKIELLKSLLCDLDGQVCLGTADDIHIQAAIDELHQQIVDYEKVLYIIANPEKNAKILEDLDTSYYDPHPNLRRCTIGTGKLSRDVLIKYLGSYHIH